MDREPNMPSPLTAVTLKTIRALTANSKSTQTKTMVGPLEVLMLQVLGRET